MASSTRGLLKHPTASFEISFAQIIWSIAESVMLPLLHEATFYGRVVVDDVVDDLHIELPVVFAVRVSLSEFIPQRTREAAFVFWEGGQA